MAETDIGWTARRAPTGELVPGYTFNPWIGCQEVSPACDHCYARVQNELRHWTKGWGPQGERTRTSVSNWKGPLSWDRKAQKLGMRLAVFCGSLCDFADNKVPAYWHSDLWTQVRCTPNLDWLMLTKRPQNVPGQLPEDWGDGYPNVWLGTTVENQAEADRRIPRLLDVPAHGHFLSCEPLLERIDIRKHMHDSDCYSVTGECDAACTCAEPRERHVGWAIAGGESGPHRRPFDLAWADDLHDQCAAANVPFYFKQDAAARPGQRGRASDALWACKSFPVAA